MRTILVILMTLFFGGEAIRSFVFAMLIGIIVGTFTSLFIAAPVAYNLMSKKGEVEAEVIASRRPEMKKKKK